MVPSTPTWLCFRQRTMRVCCLPPASCRAPVALPHHFSRHRGFTRITRWFNRNDIEWLSKLIDDATALGVEGCLWERRTDMSIDGPVSIGCECILDIQVALCAPSDENLTMILGIGKNNCASTPKDLQSVVQNRDLQLDNPIRLLLPPDGSCPLLSSPDSRSIFYQHFVHGTKRRTLHSRT